MTHRMNSGRAGCDESRTSGSEGGPGKRTGPKGQHRAPGRPYVVMVAGTKAHAEELKHDVAAVLATMGLRLSEEKTMIVHIDEGFDFLGFRIQRQTKRGSHKRYVYTWPAKKAFASIKAKVKAHETRNEPAALGRVAPAQWGAARLDQLLPARRVQDDVRLRAPVHLVARGRLASPQASPSQLEVSAKALPGKQMVARP